MGETFTPVASLEVVWTLFAYSTYKGSKVYKMDVKYAFLNGILEEKMYIEQPEGFLETTRVIWYVSYTNCCMDWNKPLENGMKGCTHIWWRLVVKGQMIMKIYTWRLHLKKGYH